MQQDLMNLLGAMYSAVLFLGATNASSVQPVVAIERTVFYRERAAGMYSALPYAFAQVRDTVGTLFKLSLLTEKLSIPKRTKDFEKIFLTRLYNSKKYCSGTLSTPWHST